MNSHKPAFEPPAADLEAYANGLNAAIADYSSDKSTTSSKADALTKITAAVGKLYSATTDPGTAMFRIVFAPQANAVVRVAVGMGLFDAIPQGGSATSIEIAKTCDMDPDFVQRIARAVASQGHLVETAEETYEHTPLSQMLCNTTAKAALARKRSP